jgi:hypothetical protein
MDLFSPHNSWTMEYPHSEQDEYTQAKKTLKTHPIIIIPQVASKIQFQCRIMRL